MGMVMIPLQRAMHCLKLAFGFRITIEQHHKLRTRQDPWKKQSSRWTTRAIASKKARMKLSTKSIDDKANRRIAELTLKEFKARVELASLLCAAGELGDAGTILEASSYLLGLVP